MTQLNPTHLRKQRLLSMVQWQGIAAAVQVGLTGYAASMPDLSHLDAVTAYKDALRPPAGHRDAPAAVGMQQSLEEVWHDAW
jgi:hypothetical protein